MPAVWSVDVLVLSITKGGDGEGGHAVSYPCIIERNILI